MIAEEYVGKSFNNQAVVPVCQSEPDFKVSQVIIAPFGQPRTTAANNSLLACISSHINFNSFSFFFFSHSHFHYLCCSNLPSSLIWSLVEICYFTANSVKILLEMPAHARGAFEGMYQVFKSAPEWFCFLFLSSPSRKKTNQLIS